MNRVSQSIEPETAVLVTERPSTPPRRSRKKHLSTYLWICLFLAPFLLLYGGFTLWPLLATIYYSFFDWNGIEPLTNFLGLGNYSEILHDPTFWLSFRNTLIFAVATTAIKLPFSLVMAIVLTRKWLWGKRLFRTAFFVPVILPLALAGQIFTLLLNPSNGALNSFLQQIGPLKAPLDLLGHDNTALLCVILISVWQIFGQYMIYWMAALQNVPEELYESAQMDGANEWRKLIHITLPTIKSTAVLISLLAVVNALHVFGLIVTLTSGGPGQSTYVMSYFIYTQAFQNMPFRYGYASAAAMLFAILAFLFVFVQGYLTRKVGGSDQARPGHWVER